MFTNMEEDILSTVKPSEEEVSKAKKTADVLCSRAVELASSKGVETEAMVVGSLAKGTFMRDVDIDIFVLFHPGVPREKLEEIGLFVGHSLLDGEERYAEHPYVHGVFQGFEIDIVPCYKVISTEQKMSAVDRTPFHTRFILDNMKVDDRKSVLLLKQFMKGIGVYGAEASVGGFSGYLCELLVLKFGNFREVLGAACEWSMGAHISLTALKKRFIEPLVFIDPVDSSRNVAAAVTQHALGLFIHASREYLRSPKVSFFFPGEPRPISVEEAAVRISERDTYPLFVSILRPSSVEDVLYPQVHKFRRTVVERLEKEGFPVIFHTTSLEDNRIALFLELETGERPKTYKHIGPPIWSAHSQRFLEKWRNATPYMEDGRWVVDTERTITTAEGLVKNNLEHWSIGKELSAMVASGNTNIHSNTTALQKMEQKMLAQAFDKRLPWER